MRTCLLLAFFFTSYFLKAQNWTIKEKEQLKINREILDTWDKELIKKDFISNKYYDSLKVEKQPFILGVFPVPNYNLIGKNSFKGIGNGAYFLYEKENRKLINVFFFSAKNDFNQVFLKDKSDEVFFNLIVLSDFYTKTKINTDNFQNSIVSRNHPDYLGEGILKTLNNKIEFLAFITADRRQYAIINLRLFDLELGRTILIAPQKDGTLHSMQINSPLLSSSELKDYNNNLINEPNIQEFFFNPDSI